jgi:hypothetical protein
MTGTMMRGQREEMSARCSNSLSAPSCCYREQGDDGWDRRYNACYNARFIQDPFTAKHRYAASQASSVGFASSSRVTTRENLNLY